MKNKSKDSKAKHQVNKKAQKSFETVWDRSDLQKPRCGFGEVGLCCHLCYMGSCRINSRGKPPHIGVCGACPEVIVAPNFARMIACGAAAHSEHGREVEARFIIFG